MGETQEAPFFSCVISVDLIATQEPGWAKFFQFCSSVAGKAFSVEFLPAFLLFKAHKCYIQDMNLESPDNVIMN